MCQRGLGCQIVIFFLSWFLCILSSGGAMASDFLRCNMRRVILYESFAPAWVKAISTSWALWGDQLYIWDPGPQNQSYMSIFLNWDFYNIRKLNKYDFHWCMVCYGRTIFGWDTTIWKSRIWGCKKNLNMENIVFKVVQMKHLAMHITNQKLSFDIFTVGNSLNIFIKTWFLLNILMIFGIK